MGLAPSSVPEHLADLHRQAAAIADRDGARELLFASGFVDGMVDGLRAARAFRALPARRAHPYPRYPMQIELQPRPEASHLFTTLAHSPEARLGSEPGAPGCFVAAGYGSGWHSALTRRTWLLREITCGALQLGACRFEARPVQAWLDLDPEWTRSLLPALRFDQVEERIDELGESGAQVDSEAVCALGLDPMCPAVQVWGPVVILPYGGVREGRTSLSNLMRDPEVEEIRVAIIDVTGIGVEGSEALGLAQLGEELRQQGIDVIIAGRRGARPGELETRDVDRGIALAFQICGPAPSQTSLGD